MFEQICQANIQVDHFELPLKNVMNYRIGEKTLQTPR